VTLYYCRASLRHRKLDGAARGNMSLKYSESDCVFLGSSCIVGVLARWKYCWVVGVQDGLARCLVGNTPILWAREMAGYFILCVTGLITLNFPSITIGATQLHKYNVPAYLCFYTTQSLVETARESRAFFVPLSIMALRFWPQLPLRAIEQVSPCWLTTETAFSNAI
jgi:hypothetical protein